MSVRAGVAQVDITPSMPVYLCGYALPVREQHKSRGVFDRLYARTICFEGPAGTALLIVLDLTGVRAERVELLCDEIEKRFGIPRDSVTVAAIHTHSAPMLAGDAPGGEQPAGYLPEIHERILGGVEQAVSGLRPIRMGYGFAVADVCHNRRHVNYDGTVVDEWSDEVSRYGLVPTGPYDPIVRLLRIEDGEGAPLCVLSNFSCHPVTLTKNNLHISADYVGYYLDYLEQAGGFPLAVHTTGAAGDTNPSRRIDDITLTRRMGITIGTAAANALDGIATVAVSDLRLVREQFRFEPGRDRSSGVGEVTLIAFDDTVICVVPGEVVYELGMQIRAGVRRYTSKAVIVTCADAYLGYFITDTIAAEGAYEAGRSAGPDAAGALLGAVNRGLDRLIAERGGR